MAHTQAAALERAKVNARRTGDDLVDKLRALGAPGAQFEVDGDARVVVKLDQFDARKLLEEVAEIEDEAASWRRRIHGFG